MLKFKFHVRTFTESIINILSIFINLNAPHFFPTRHCYCNITMSANGHDVGKKK